MKVKIYQYAGCSTCKKALKWLKAQGIDHEALPIVEKPPSAAQLKKWAKKSGLPLKRFFNTAGQSYRQGNFKERLPNMSDAEKFEALAADGKLIKRPLLVAGEAVLVGFSEKEWGEKLLP
jgi:arsenate reductase